MSVLLRKPDLVHRYSCVLQVLESSVDLVNDDKMVRHEKKSGTEKLVYACARHGTALPQWRQFLSSFA